MKIIFMLIFFLTGCIDVFEIEEYALVAGIGIDYNEGFELTAEMVKQEDGKTSSMKGVPISIKGDTLEECLEKLDFNYPNKPYLSHCNLIVIGEEMAKRGFYEPFNFLLHDADFRIATPILIVKNETAKDFLIENPFSDIISYDIAKVLKENEKRANIAKIMSLYQVVNTKEDEVIVLPTCEIKEKHLDLYGGAVVSNYKVIDYLTNEDINALKIFDSSINEGHIQLNEYSIFVKAVKNDLSYVNDSFLWKSKIEISFGKNPDNYDEDSYESLELIEEEVKNLFLQTLNERMNKFHEKEYDLLKLKKKLYRMGLPIDSDIAINNDVVISIKLSSAIS